MLPEHQTGKRRRTKLWERICPTRLETITALHGRSETGITSSKRRRGGGKCLKFGRVVIYKCDSAAASENEQELNEECMSFGI